MLSLLSPAARVATTPPSRSSPRAIATPSGGSANGANGDGDSPFSSSCSSSSSTDGHQSPGPTTTSSTHHHHHQHHPSSLPSGYPALVEQLPRHAGAGSLATTAAPYMYWHHHPGTSESAGPPGPPPPRPPWISGVHRGQGSSPERSGASTVAPLFRPTDYSPSSPHQLFASPYSQASFFPASSPGSSGSGPVSPSQATGGGSTSSGTAPYFFPFAPHHHHAHHHNLPYPPPPGSISAYLPIESYAAALAAMGQTSGASSATNSPSSLGQPTRPTPLHFPKSTAAATPPSPHQTSNSVSQFALFPPPPLPPLLSSSSTSSVPTYSTPRSSAAGTSETDTPSPISPKYFAVPPPPSSPYHHLLGYHQQQRHNNRTQYQVVPTTKSESSIAASSSTATITTAQKHRLVVRPPQHSFQHDPVVSALPPGADAAAAAAGLSVHVAGIASARPNVDDNEDMAETSTTTTIMAEKCRQKRTSLSSSSPHTPTESAVTASASAKTSTMRQQFLRRAPPAHFARGSVIQLAGGELRCVEDLRTEDFVRSAELSADLRIDSSTVVRIEEGPGLGLAVLGFSVGDRKLQVTVEAAPEHPFFVFGQGWSSCLPERTQLRYGLACHRLQVGDVCISLANRVSASPSSCSATAAKTVANSLWRLQHVPPPRSSGATVDVPPSRQVLRKRRWSASDAASAADRPSHVPGSAAEQRSNSLAESSLVGSR